MRDRKAELDVSFPTRDAVAGLATGHASKVLGPGPVHAKNLGPISLPSLLGALGVKLVLVEGEAAMAKLRGRLTHRYRAGMAHHDVRHLDARRTAAPPAA